jgi:hypothetical protein
MSENLDTHTIEVRDQLLNDIQTALELLKTKEKKCSDGTKECEFCDSSVGHICESCFLASVILRMRNKIRRCNCD